MNNKHRHILTGIFLISIIILKTQGHGRLIEPPSRSTMWRYGFSTPPNYNDHESYCGGFTRQWQTNGGKCGICGDPWDEKEVRSFIQWSRICSFLTNYPYDLEVYKD